MSKASALCASQFPQLVTSETVTGAVSDALRREYAELRNAPKLLARRVQATPRSIRNWMDGSRAPRAAELVRLMAESDAVADAVLRLVEISREARSGG